LKASRTSLPCERPIAASLVVSVRVTRADEERWRRAAAKTELGLLEWLRAVADAAADAALSGSRQKLISMRSPDRGSRPPTDWPLAAADHAPAA
jgi:hypothetical protein